MYILWFCSFFIVSSLKWVLFSKHLSLNKIIVICFFLIFDFKVYEKWEQEDEIFY